MFLVYSIK